MAMQRACFGGSACRPISDDVWAELYRVLRPSVLSWVYASGVSSWLGQEHDIADDILQEAVIRTLKYNLLAESGQGNPINSITCFGRTVAQNHFRDLRRRELRLVRPQAQDGEEVTVFDLPDLDVDPAEVAVEELARVSLLQTVARIIADFPPKQRTALLIDLAKLTDFADEQCPLRAALHAVGIDLADYRHAQPSDPQERGRHAASLSMAYKRLRQSYCYQDDDFLL